MWKLLFLVHLYIINGSCQVIVAPLNMAVVVGQRLDMTCQPESTFTVRAWIYQPPFNAADLKIYANWSTPKIHIDRFGYDTDSNDSINIYLNSTGPEDAGTYNCFVQLGSRQPDSYSAQVIVLETEPFCEDVMYPAYMYNDILEEGSVVWMRCSLSFRGNLAPTMEWRQHGGSGEIDERDRDLTGMVETTVIPDTNITSRLSIVIDATYNATFFTCKTYFQWDNTSSLRSRATNPPDYSYIWNSSVIIVSAKAFIASSEKGSWLTTVYSFIVVLSICIGIATITICIVKRRKFKAGSTKKEEETTADSNPGDYQTINENPTIGDSQTATYMGLTSLTQASLSDYTNIDIAGKMLTMPRTPSPDYEDMTDI